MIRFLHILKRDERGNALVEAAIVMPVLATLFAGATDMSQAYAKKIRIQQAAARSIELATASGYNNPAFNTLQDDAATAAGVPSSSVVVDKWLECNGTRQSSFSGTCATGQFIARYVSINIAGQYRPFFATALRYAHVSPDGNLALSGYAAVRVQ